MKMQPAMMVVACILAAVQVVQLARGQAASAPKPFIEADVLARQLVDDIKHNRPGSWRELRGRNDVVLELRKMAGLSTTERRQLLDAVLTVGMQQNQQRWVFSPDVTAYMVEVAVSDEAPNLREYAADLLVEHVPSSGLAIHAAALLKATESGKLQNALLVGKTGAAEAKPLLQKDGKLWSTNEAAARAAAAKLGDTAVSESFVASYLKESDPRRKASLANTLGYIGDAACVLALAKDMRTPLVYNAGGATKSLRMDIVAALSETYPREAVLWRRDVSGNEEIDAWYEAVEKWLEGYLGITWNTPRPKPLVAQPIPTPTVNSPRF